MAAMVTTKNLKKNTSYNIIGGKYKSTREILDFAHAFLIEGLEPEEINEEENNLIRIHNNRLEAGEQPDLIYCHDFYEEANKIAVNIKELKGAGADYGDMCVTFVHRSCKGINYLNILEEIFKKSEMPYFILDDKEELKLDKDLVNISTIENMKEVDFKYVFICGINDSLVDNIRESKNVLYLGITKATEILNVTYSIDNAIVDDLINAKIKINQVSAEEIRQLMSTPIDSKRKRYFRFFSKIKGIFNR